MHKTLKFVPSLVPLILSGEKVSTWRLWDDKNLAVGDVVHFLEYRTNNHFATGKITKVIEKLLGELTQEDKQGHEQFESNEKMYEVYTTYYGREVNKETIVKMIRFALVK